MSSTTTEHQRELFEEEPLSADELAELTQAIEMAFTRHLAAADAFRRLHEFSHSCYARTYVSPQRRLSQTLNRVYGRLTHGRNT